MNKKTKAEPTGHFSFFLSGLFCPRTGLLIHSFTKFPIPHISLQTKTFPSLDVIQDHHSHSPSMSFVLHPALDELLYYNL